MEHMYTDMQFSNTCYLDINIVLVNLLLQVLMAKIDTFEDNEILNQGQFHYCILKPLFEEDIFDENTTNGIQNEYSMLKNSNHLLEVKGSCPYMSSILKTTLPLPCY